MDSSLKMASKDVKMSSKESESPDMSKCVYLCNDPSGSLIIATAVVFCGAVIVPAFLDILGGVVPFTGEGFLQCMYLEISRAIGYDPARPVFFLVLYFIFSVLGGMASMKPSKALALPFLVMAILVLAFFFLARFILGEVIYYDAFFAGFFVNLIAFSITFIMASLVGLGISKMMMSAKQCYVKGRGIILKE